MQHLQRILGVTATLFTCACLYSTVAHADTVRGSRRGFNSIQKGVVEIGVDNVFLMRYNKVNTDPNTTVANMSTSYVGGLTPRYFVVKNLSLSLNLDFFYRKDSVTVTTTPPSGGDTKEDTNSNTDTGFLGTAMVNYYLRLGHGLFFKPGVGGGGFVGSRERPTAGQPGQVTKTKLSGGAGRLDLGFAFYASNQFSMRAGIDVIARFGSEKADADVKDPNGATPDPQSFTTVDAGVNVGIGYTF